MAYDTIIIENNPVNVLESFHEELNQEQFNIQSVITRDMGGFWSAKFNILQPRRNYALQMLANGPGRSVKFFNEKSIPVWEGFISKVTVGTGAASAFNDVQPVANDVWVRYRDIITGNLTRSAHATHTNSQNKYGQKDWVLSGGQLAGAVADQKAENFLNLNFWATPQLDSFEIGGGGGRGEIDLQVQCLGWWHTLDWRVYNQTVDVGSVNTSTLMDEIIGEFVSTASLRNNLISWWTLDEPSAGVGAVVRADSFGTNDLGDTGTTESTDGKVNRAADFVPADNNYLSIVDNATLSFGNEDFAFCAWVYLDAKPNNMRLVAKYDNGANDREYLLYFNFAANRFYFSVSSDGTAPGVTSAVANTLGAPALATWYFIVCWHDSVANTLNIEVDDGGVDSAAHAGGCNDNISPFALGANPVGPAEVLDGRIDEVGIWRRILSADERTILYNDGDGMGYSDVGKTRRAGGIGEFVAETIIESNATQVTREYDADRRAGGIIKAAAELGDSTGLTWNAYMGLDRIFYFQPSAPPFEETL